MNRPFPFVKPLRFEGKTGEGVDIFGRRETTSYQIETSLDDKGHYFDIYLINQVEGDPSVRRCVYASDINDGAPFETEDAAVEAGKLWIQTKAKM